MAVALLSWPSAPSGCGGSADSSQGVGGESGETSGTGEGGSGTDETDSEPWSLTTADGYYSCVGELGDADSCTLALFNGLQRSFVRLGLDGETLQSCDEDICFEASPSGETMSFGGDFDTYTTHTVRVYSTGASVEERSLVCRVQVTNALYQFSFESRDRFGLLVQGVLSADSEEVAFCNSLLASYLPSSCFHQVYYDCRRVEDGLSEEEIEAVHEEKEDLWNSLTATFNTLTGGSSPTASSQTTCGNGLVEYPGELCDDGNTVSGDGCGSGCFPETATCGNAKIEAPETCDDGNNLSGDGCASYCQWESAVSVTNCNVVSDCTPLGTDYSCVNGACQLSGCVSSAECQNGLTCYQGRCKTICSDPLTCRSRGPYSACNDSVCQDSCTSTNQCQQDWGYTCVSGTCRSPGACSVNGDCAADWTCDSGTCRKICSIPDDCMTLGTDYACQGGVCKL